MQWQRLSMVVTFCGILATGWRARAEEPPRDAGAVPGAQPSTASSPDGGAGAPVTAGAMPSAGPTQSSAAADGGAQGMPIETAPAAPFGPAAPPVSPEAAAQSSGAPGTMEGPAEPAPKGKKRKNKAPKAGKVDAGRDDGPSAYGTLEFKARLYVRGEYAHRDVIALNDMLQPVPSTVDSLDITVPKAHVAVDYQSPLEWLSAVIEMDVSGKPHMRDAYIQARSSEFLLRAGRFKLPVASVDTASPWSIPLVRRGLIHDVLVDRLDYGGRRPGVMAGWHGHGGLHPKLMVGAFQGKILAEDPTPIERDTDLIDSRSLDSQSVVARAQIEVAKTEIGAFYENRIGAPNTVETERYWTVGADAHYDRVFESGGLRFWLDGLSGQSWYELATKAPDGKDAIFIAARALVAYRFGGVAEEDVYVEPYVDVGGIDPDIQVTEDLLYEAAVGVNVGYWKRARLSLQGEINKGMRNFPTGYFAGLPPDRLGLILQAGVAF